MFQKWIRFGLPALLGAAVTALVFLTISAAQVGTLGGQTLGNCEIEVRPKITPKLMVIWEDTLTATDATLTFEALPMKPDKVGMGDHEAGSDVLAKATRNDRVTFKWDRTLKTLALTVTNGTDTKNYANVPYEGRFDPLARSVPPVLEEVDRQSANPKLKRLRLTTQFRGLKVAWTIWDN